MEWEEAMTPGFIITEKREQSPPPVVVDISPVRGSSILPLYTYIAKNEMRLDHEPSSGLRLRLHATILFLLPPQH
ncbi:unnamed protein product [Heligmosomoides polygyrus]|uniref:Uncharacterized protein n=1 Tax=Heligmosomoides polygyrus TaxID=6339 RepID=A0A183FK75_HELPZ|nr:unnamed protein product [Heligmosomoides polygyrus]